MLSSDAPSDDVTAFGQLVERYHNLVTAIAYSRTGDRAQSEDIAQETFLVAWADASRLRDPQKLRPWLCGIARNLAAKTLRRQRRERSEDSEQLDTHAARDSGPLSALISKETEASVWAALEQLPPTFREPLVLFYREDQSIKQVADGLGLSEQAAKQRISRGRVSLKANLEVVEQTIASSRPRKAAVAAVLAALALTAKSTQAAAATKPVAWKLAAAGALAAAAIGVGVVVTRSSEPPRQDDHDRALLAQLRQAHEASGAKAGAATGCELHGGVTLSDGSPARGVLVASIAHGWQTATLEPAVTETDARGRWTLAVPRGSSTVSVTIAGQRAQSRVVTCVSSHADTKQFVLDPDGTTLRGLVTDVGGGSIAGATIWLADPQTPDAIFVTRSDSAGAYELRVHPGAYVIMVIHPDYTIDLRPVAIGDAPARENFAVLPAASIEGVVVDATGAPVPSARIEIAPEADSAWAVASTYAALLPYAADANGRFVVRGLPPGSVRLSARTAALATTQPTSVDVAFAEEKTGVTVTVGAARTVAGFIIARGGQQGLAEIRVTATREGLPLGPPIATATDASGYFALAGLTPGAYRLSAIGDGYVPYFTDEPIVVADRDLDDRLVRLDRGVSLRGHVEPAGAVSLKLQPADRTDRAAWIRAALARADIDERGNFVFAAVPPGRYVITATTYDRRGELPITVATLDQAQLRVALDPLAKINGHVVDDMGRPVAGALVETTATPIDPWTPLTPAIRTDEQGAFHIVARPGASYRVRVFDARGQRPWAGDKRPFAARTLTPGTNEKLVVASGGGRVSGVVVGADHQPVADTWIEVRARDARDYPPLYRPAPVATDAAGRFSIDGVFGSELLVEASNGLLHADASARTGDHVELVLRAPSTLIGEVAGTPRLDVTLRNKQTDRVQRQQATGSFQMSAFPGEYDLVVTSQTGYAMRAITIESEPSTRVDVTLVPWASVRGKVVGADGKPWANASIFVRERAEPTRTQTDGAGMFALDRMVVGHNQLTFFERGSRDTIRVEIELAAGQHLDLETIEGRAAADTNDVGALLRSLEPQTTASASPDLGLQFFVAAEPPSDVKLAQLARDPLLAYRERRDAKAALWIVAVAPDSPAARAGLRRGDRVIAVGSRRVGTGQSAADAGMSLSTRWRSRGIPIRWTVSRDGHELAVDVLVPD